MRPPCRPYRGGNPRLYKEGRHRDDFNTPWEVRTEGVCGIPVEWPFADWGEQARLLIAPELWRKLFKPAYKTMFEKAIGAGMDVHFHGPTWTGRESCRSGRRGMSHGMFWMSSNTWAR